MGRRGENIRKRKDGRWEARIVVGCPVDGKTNYKFIYAKTYRDAKQLKEQYYLAMKTSKLKRHNRELNSVKFNSTSNINEVRNSAKETTEETPPILFKEAANEWLADKKLSVKESSYSYYVEMIKNHVMPDLGNLPLSEVTTQKLSDYFIEKNTRGNKGRTALKR